jgi:DNA-binding SARP family transcriptional activator
LLGDGQRRGSKAVHHNTALLDRIGAADVRYVCISAPAGFGKSALVRAFGQLHPEVTIQSYDCRELTDLATAQRASEDWSTRSGAGTHVFDHVDEIVSEHEAMLAVRTLLARLAPGARAIFLSRCPLPAALFDDASPHEILALSLHDLEFDSAAVRHEFDDAISDKDSLAEIMRVIRGWPAAVLFFRRLIRSEMDVAVLLDLAAPPIRVFHDYVQREVLRPLSAANLETLVACATLPHAGFEDVAAALGIESADERLEALSAVFPLLGYHADASIMLHPLVMATLKARHAGSIQRSVTRAIEMHIERGAMVSAARVYLELGQLDEAASVLGRAQIDFQSTHPTFEELAVALDESVVCASPTLWNIMFRFRRYRHAPGVLLVEAEQILSAMHSSKTSPLEAGITASMALLLCDLGEYARAQSLCIALEARAAEQDVNVETFSKMAQAVVMSHKGRDSDALALYQRAGLSTSFNAFPTSRQLNLEARAARARGRFGIETELHRRHLHLAQRSGTAAFEGTALAEAAFSAWLAGHDDRMLQHAATYRENVPRALGYCFNELFFSLSADRDGQIAIGGPLPRINAYCGLIRSGTATHRREKIRCAQLAEAAADGCKDGFLSILSRVTRSYLEPLQRARCMREFLVIAQTIESPELFAAIEALAHDAEAHAGMLEPLARRYRQTPANQTPVYRIDVLQGSVTRDGSTLPASTGTMALLVALALGGKRTSRDDLCSLLWPDGERGKAGNALKMCVRRLRSQLDDISIIDWTSEGYLLRADTVVDLGTVLPVVDAALCRDGIPAEEIVALRSTFDALAAKRPPFMLAWEWFEPTERRLRNMEHELGVLLATAAFDRGDSADCLAVTQKLLAADPCDEEAHELRIRLRVRAGDLAAAARGFHSYRVLLKEELGIEPRSEFKELCERSIV